MKLTFTRTKFLVSFILMVILVANSKTFAQNSLPQQIKLSPDLKRLTAGGYEATGLYNMDLIKTIYLNFDQPNFIALLKAAYAKDTSVIASLTMDGITYDSVGVNLKGNSSYLGLPIGSNKFSFNFEMDAWKPEQTLKGYKTINLHNGYNDPSFMKEVFYVNQIQKYLPSQKASYTHLFINGLDWGLYANLQQMNKDFLGEWFFSNDGSNWRADNYSGNGYCALGYVDNDTNSYIQRYELKSSDIASPYSDLLNAITSLNLPSLADLPNKVEDSIDVDRALWFLACENAFGDFDSYTQKGKRDYYIYYEPESHRLVPMQYDGNSAISPAREKWSPFFRETNAAFPLIYKLLNVPDYRERYVAHLLHIMSSSFDTTYAYSVIDSYASKIDTLVIADTMKLYSNADFDSTITQIKAFIKNRKDFIFSSSQVKSAGPTISNVKYSTNGIVDENPTDQDSVLIEAKVFHSFGLTVVNCYWSDELTGKFNKIRMNDNGLNGDAVADDSIFSVFIPKLSASKWVRFYIEAKANTKYISTTFSPPGAEHDVYIYFVKNAYTIDKPVVINEFMADNTISVADNLGHYEDWIELFNTSNVIQDLSGFYLSDDSLNLKKFKIVAGTKIEPQGYQIFWADEAGSEGINHCNFKLSKKGEMIFLSDTIGQVMDKIVFGAQLSDFSYARNPNGVGNFVLAAETHGCHNQGVLPGLRISEPDSIITCLNSAMLHCDSGATYTYNWFADGIKINNSNSHEITISTSGNYFVEITTNCGIITTQNVHVTFIKINDSITSIANTFCANTAMEIKSNYDSLVSYQWLYNNTILANSDSNIYNAINAGSYRVIRNANGLGCLDTSNAITLTKLPIPNAIVTALGPTNFCEGLSVKLSTAYGSVFTYQWKKNGINIPNAVNRNYKAKHEGLYSVMVTKSGLCSNISSGISVTTIDCKVGSDLDNVNSNSELKIYPNPTNGIFELQIPATIDEGDYKIQIYSNQGKLVKEIYSSSRTQTIDAATFSKGIYLCRVYLNENFINATRLIVD